MALLLVPGLIARMTEAVDGTDITITQYLNEKITFNSAVNSIKSGNTSILSAKIASKGFSDSCLYGILSKPITDIIFALKDVAIYTYNNIDILSAKDIQKAFEQVILTCKGQFKEVLQGKGFNYNDIFSWENVKWVFEQFFSIINNAILFIVNSIKHEIAKYIIGITALIYTIFQIKSIDY
jgi:hypothetical protein